MVISKEPVRILYMDDSPLDIKLITSTLQAAEEEFKTSIDAVSTRDAYLVALQKCEHDVILCDYRMPGYGGDEALRDARLICPDVPFIMVTGELGEELAIETLKRGATDYVLKDRLARLVPSIKRALKEAAAERERQNIARSLVEAQRMAQIGSWEWDIQTGELHWSRQLYTIIGIDPHAPSMTMDVFARFIHPDDRELVREKVAQVTGEGTSVEFDFRIIRADGSVRVLRTMGEVRKFDELGRPLIMAGTNQDITERTEAAQRLAESESRLRMIQEASLDGFTILRPVRDNSGQIIDFVWVYENAAVARMNGTIPDGVVGKNLLDLFPGHRHTRFFQAYCEAALTGKSKEFEEHYRGETITTDTWFRIVVVPAKDTIAILAQDITARKQTEEALRESEERFAAMLAASRDIIYRYNIQADRFDYVSPSIEEMLGYSAGEIQVMNNAAVTSLIHPDDLADLARAQAELLKAGTAEAMYRQRTKGGHYRWFSNQMSLSRNERGEPQYRTGNVRDITERKVAEEELQRSQRRLEDMIRYAPTFIYEIDFRKRCFTRVNEAMCAFSGYTREEMLAKDPMEFLYEESRARFKERIAQWLHGEKPQEDVEYHVKLREGDDRWVILKVTFVADDKGQPLGATVIGHDITERRRMEEALRESEEKFRVLTEASPAAVLVYRGNRHLYVNAAAVKIFGYTMEELLQMNFLDLIHPDHRPIVSGWVQARTRGESKPARYEVKVQTKDGREKWIDVSSGLISYGDAPAGIVSCIDISGKKSIEETIKRSAENLRFMVQGEIRPMLVVDREGLVEAASEAGSALLGYKEKELLGHNVQEMVVPLSRMEAALQLGELRKHAPRPLTATLRVLRKNGSSMWATVEVSLVVAGDGVTEKYLVKFETLDVGLSSGT